MDNGWQLRPPPASGAHAQRFAPQQRTIAQQGHPKGTLIKMLELPKQEGTGRRRFGEKKRRKIGVFSLGTLGGSNPMLLFPK